MKRYIYTLMGLFLFLFSTLTANAQMRVMPVGNSITWGKVNNADPPSGEEGYRKYLYNYLDADANLCPSGVTFVGDYGTYAGHFMDGARVGWFVPDSSEMPITPELSQYNPDVVLLHIGTNNVGKGMTLGNYAQPSSVMGQLYKVIKAIIDYSSVDHLFLCYIVPKYSSASEEAEVQNYNNAISIMLNDISGEANFYKITEVDMWTPFNAKSSTYYNLDVDPIHPNTTGYKAMAQIFYNYMQKELVSSETDEFNRASLGSNWAAASGISILDKGENGGGALQFTALGDLNWDNMAVWKKTKNLTSVSMTTHGDATSDALQYVGVAVGLDGFSATASGYLVWVRGGKINIKTIANGNANNGVDISTDEKIYPTNTGIASLAPGETIKVSYQAGSTENRFSVTIPGRLDDALSFSDSNKRAGNADTLYSGILFKGETTTALNYLIDSYTVESQLPDPVAPGAPTELSAFSIKKTSVLLTWTAPGNDGYSPNTRAASYDMRYSTSSITEDNWAQATIVPLLPTPSTKGTSEEYSLTGLAPETHYYVRIMAIDEWGNKSELSDEVDFTTKVAGFRWDTFARQPASDGSIGSDWAINTNEYTITYDSGNPEESVFVNFGTDYEWGRVSVFKAVPDPLIAKMVWGRSATEQGIFKGGMALMLDSKTINANGYLLFIRSTTYGSKVYLYNILNGAVVTTDAGKIDEAAYTLYEGGSLRLPAALDTMTVIIDRYDEAGIKFDVRLNNEPVTSQPLYDDQKRHNTATNYAGIMLGRLNKANPVQAFGASSTIIDIDDIELYQGSGNVATVGEEMSDSLLARVVDTNGSPMSDIPVSFWTLSPSDASITAPDASFSFNPIVFEAEWDIEVEGTYSEYDDANASGGKYMNATTGDAGAGELSYTFYVDKDTTYYFWGRVIASSISSMAVSVQVTSGSTTESFVWNSNYYGSSNNFSSSWRWDRIHEQSSTTPFSMELSKGECEIIITKAHSNVKLDRFLLTYSSSYTPPALLTAEVLKTDSRGIAGTKLTLGEAVGANRVRVSAFGTSILKTFEVTGVASAPTRVVAANQNQTTDNWVNQPLSKPFEVTLYDQYNNAVEGVTVEFSILQGDGTISQESDITDSNGKASTLLTLGFETTENIIQATFPGTSLSAVNFYGKADKGLAKAIESQTSSTSQKHYVNQQFNNFLKVKVINDQDAAMAGVPVKFEALGIPATFGSVTKYTNSEGIVQDTLKLGSTTGVLQVKATSVGVSSIVYTDSVYNRATKISIQSSTGAQTVGVGATTPIALKVRVYSGTEGMSNQPVKFVAKNFASNGFHFPGATGNGDTLIIYTTSTGYAETKVIAGPKHGEYQNVIEAQATDGFYPVTNSPIKFSLTARSDAYKLVYLSGNNQEGVVGTELPNSLQVQMLTISNVPVANQPVVFKITQGDGKFTTTDYTEYTAETDGDGIADVMFVLGKKVGDENVNIIQATATDGLYELGGSPVEFKLYAKSSNADSLAAVSADSSKGTVGKALSQKIQVMAYGTLGEPAVGAKVKFSVVKGGGTVTTAGDTTTTVTIAKADGIAEVSWILGSKAGTGNHKLQVSLLDDNGDHLKGSPRYFYASASPDVVDTLASTVQATGPRQASGADSSIVTVTLKDKYSNPISDKWVGITVTPNNWDSFYESTIGPTDAQGQAKGYLVSTSAGQKIITAKVKDGVSLKKTATVIFLANDAAKMSRVTSSTPSGNIGTVYRDSLVVRITDDQDNPVAYGPVLFKAVTDGAFVVDTTGAFVKSFRNYSNAQGYASFYPVLNNVIGENVYEVSGTDINNVALQGSPVTFSISGKAGTAITMFRVSQATDTGVAGKNLDLPLTVGVEDDGYDPVANVPVVFKVVEGSGKVQTSGAVYTDAYGHAEVTFQADTKVGKKNMVTATANLSGSPVAFTIYSIPDVAYQLSYASDAVQSGIVGGSTTQNLKVLVADRYGNPVSGYAVRYEIMSGTATIRNGSTASDTSDANGYVSMPLKLGTATGTVKVKATSDYLLGAPLIFTVYAYTVDPVNIVRYPASNATIVGTKGKQLIDPLRVMVLDQYENPVPNVTVLFAASTNNTGDGYVLETSPVASDANGIASAHYICRTTVGTEQVRALLSDKEVIFNIQSVTNAYSPTLNRDVWPANKTFENFEGDQFKISVRANPDGDGDPITFEIANLFPPEGMNISVQSPNSTAMIEWTPTSQQQGTYVIYPRITDGKGGSDMDSLTLIVKNFNLVPMIVDWVPRIDTLMYSGQTVRFWVEAYDEDDDDLHYAWYADNIRVGDDSPLLELSVDKYYSGVMSVRVIVSDGYTTTQFQWSPNFMTAIELAEFVAAYDMWEQTIQLDWRTFSEVNNVGFYIARGTIEDGEYERITEDLIPGNMLHTYQFVDKEIRSGSRYYYKLIDVNDQGFESEHGPLMVSIPVPDKFDMYQNFPNPFNPDTKIRYQVPHRTDVKLVLYNMMGQQVQTLVDEVKEAGFYTVTWDGRDSAGRQTSTGVYLYRFVTPDQTITKKMLKMQ